jgi:hypothetical protein
MIRRTLLAASGAVVLGISFFFLARSISPTTTDNLDTLHAANGLYQSGHYRESIRLYTQLIEQGVRDPVVFHNLANSYAQVGDQGRALLNYHRAAGLDPRNPVIRQHLEASQAAVEKSQLPGDQGLIDRFTAFTSRWLTLNELALGALGSWLIVFGLLTLVQMMKTGKMRSILSGILVALLLPLALMTVSLAGRIHSTEATPVAIIVADQSNLNTQPDPGMDTGAILQNGMQVVLTEEKGSWTYVYVPGTGWQGWIPSDTFEKIRLPPPEGYQIML